MIISVLHKTNVERQARVQQISQQQRLQQHVLQHLRIENDRRQNTPNVRIQQNVQMYSNQNQTRNNDVSLLFYSGCLRHILACQVSKFWPDSHIISDFVNFS